MTRKKWNRLKRTRPELFKGLVFEWKGQRVPSSWEFVSKHRALREYSSAEVVAILTGEVLSQS